MRDNRWKMPERNKRDCMRNGTGICPRNETWAAHEQPCDDCKHYIDKNGETGEVDDGRA